MKKAITFLMISAAMFTLSAETIKLEFQNNNGFEQTTPKGQIKLWTYNPYSKTFKGGGTMTSVPNGYKGKAVKLKCQDGQRLYFYSAKAAKIKEGKDTVKVSLWCKGKGTLQISLYGYTAANKNAGGWDGKKIAIDTPEWKQYTWSIPLKTKGKNITNIRIAPVIFGATDLEIDEFEVVIERMVD